jgi:hypothetical protein
MIWADIELRVRSRRAVGKVATNFLSHHMKVLVDAGSSHARSVAYGSGTSSSRLEALRDVLG